ncbi:MAG: CAP-associated domain-containing protein, partial [Intestinibacter bartlettii]|uniref:CAP-associated domain-containing protein n=1 Tax=Intestinibacter bartlettii TaxID=261299 RepID=UPI0026EAC22A
MKKFFTIVVILGLMIFMFRSPIRNITGDLIDFVQVKVFDKINIADNSYDEDSTIQNEDELDESVSNYSGTSSYDNYQTIKLGESEQNVIAKMGEPNKKEGSEYGFEWYVYNQDLNKF